MEGYCGQDRNAGKPTVLLTRSSCSANTQDSGDLALRLEMQGFVDSTNPKIEM